MGLKNKSCEGFILWILLCFFALLSLLITTGLRHVLNYHQAMNKRELSHQHFYQLEYAMRIILKMPFSKNCIKPLQEDNQLLQVLRHQQGCFLKIEKKKYLYLIEELGDFPCLLVGDDIPSQHFRITLLSEQEKSHTGSFLQIRWVQRATKGTRCLREKKIIKEGLSSWRFITLS